jgi:hypothetical protein
MQDLFNLLELGAVIVGGMIAASVLGAFALFFAGIALGVIQ